MHTRRRMGGRKRKSSGSGDYAWHHMATSQQRSVWLQPRLNPATEANTIPFAQATVGPRQNMSPPVPNNRLDHTRQPQSATGRAPPAPLNWCLPRQPIPKGPTNVHGPHSTPQPSRAYPAGNQRVRTKQTMVAGKDKLPEHQIADLRRFLHIVERRSENVTCLSVHELSKMFARQFNYTIIPRKIIGYIVNHMSDIGEFRPGKDSVMDFYWKNGQKIPDPFCAKPALVQMRAMLVKEMGEWRDGRLALADVMKRYVEVYGGDFPHADCAYLSFRANFSDIVGLEEMSLEGEWWVVHKNRSPPIKAVGGEPARKADETAARACGTVRDLVIRKIMAVLYNRWKDLISKAVCTGWPAPGVEAVFDASGGGGGQQEVCVKRVSCQVSEGSEVDEDILDFSQSHDDDLALKDCSGDVGSKVDAACTPKPNSNKDCIEIIQLADLLKACGQFSNKEALKEHLLTLKDPKVEVVEEWVKVRSEHGLPLLQRVLSLRTVMFNALASETMYASQRKLSKTLTSTEMLASVRAVQNGDSILPHSFGYNGWEDLIAAPFLSDICKIQGSDITVVFDPVKQFRAYLDGQMKTLASMLEATKPPKVMGCTPREVELGHCLSIRDARADFEELFGYPLDFTMMGFKHLEDCRMFEDIIWFRKKNRALYLHPSPLYLLGILIEEHFKAQLNESGGATGSPEEILEPLSTLPTEFTKKYGYNLNPTVVGYNSLLMMFKDLGHICTVVKVDGAVQHGTMKLTKPRHSVVPPLIKSHVEKMESLGRLKCTEDGCTSGKERSSLTWVNSLKDFVPSEEIRGKKLAHREVDNVALAWCGRSVPVEEGPLVEGVVNLL